jgi:hypothetical protein
MSSFFRPIFRLLKLADDHGVALVGGGLKLKQILSIHHLPIAAVSAAGLA